MKRHDRVTFRNLSLRGDRPIIESVKPNDPLDLLATWEPLDVDFPDIDSGLLSFDDPKQ